MALFRTIQEVKESAEVSLQLNFEDILPAINIAEQKYLLPLLSKSVYDALALVYNNNPNITSGTSADAELLKMIRPMIANYAVAIAMPRLNVEITGAGIHITSTDHKKTAFAWQVKEAQSSYITAGDMYADKLLSFLEENKATYTTWAASTAFTEYIDALVYTTQQVDDVIKIGSSRLLFMRMKPKLKMVQDFQVIDTLSSEFVDEIMASIRAGNTIANNLVILPMIQKAMIYIAAADTLKEGVFVFNADGVTLISNQNTTDVINAKNTASGSVVEKTAEKWNALGMAWLERVRVYLNKNASASVYPIYFGSDLYEDPTNSTEPLTNDPNWGVGMF